MAVNQVDTYEEPLYYIGVVAKMLDLHPQTLRHYERIGLVVPQRTEGNVRLYSQRNVDRLQKINRLTSELGVNLAGVEVILNLLERMDELQQEMERMEHEFNQELETLRARYTNQGDTRLG